MTDTIITIQEQEFRDKVLETPGYRIIAEIFLKMKEAEHTLLLDVSPDHHLDLCHSVNAYTFFIRALFKPGCWLGEIEMRRVFRDILDDS